MGKKSLTFGDIGIEENRFYCNKTLIFGRDLGIEKVLLSNKISFGENDDLYNDDNVKPFNIMLAKTSTYVKVIMDKLNGCIFYWRWWIIRKNDIIWDQVSAAIKKEIDSEPVYDKEFLKTKIKYHGDEVPGLYNKEIPKVDSNHTCLAVISSDFALRKLLLSSLFLKEVNILRKKRLRHCHDNLSDFSTDDDDESYEE